MYQARRLPSFCKGHILRSTHRTTTPAANTQAVINENNRRVKAYNLLVNSRKLWEESDNNVNRTAFKVVPATREVEVSKKREIPVQFADFEAPEQALSKREEKALKPWKYAYLNTRDLPEDRTDKIWRTPDEMVSAADGVERLDFEETDDFKKKDSIEEDEADELDGTLIRENQKKYDTARQKKRLAQRLMLGKGPKAGEDDFLGQREDRLHEMEHDPYKPTYISDSQSQAEFIKKLNDRESEEKSEDKLKEEEQDDDHVEEQDDDLTQDLTARNKRRKCLLCGIKAPKVHPMNVYLLSRFVSPHGDIFPRSITGNCMRHQRDINRLFRSMKGSGLVTFKKGFTIHIPFEPPLGDGGVDKDQEVINQHLEAVGLKDAPVETTAPKELEGIKSVRDLEYDPSFANDMDYDPEEFSPDLDDEYADGPAPEDLHTVIDGGRHTKNVPPRSMSSAPSTSPYPTGEQPKGLVKAKSGSQEWRKKRPEKGVVPMSERSKRDRNDDRRNVVD